MRTKKIIKRVALLLVITNIFLLTGCWNYTEIDDQINVSGFAIDKGEEGKKYHLSAEIINIGKGKQSQISTEVIESDGDTVFEAIRDMITVSSKKLYFGHCKILIISNEVAKEGIAKVMDLVMRDQETRLTMEVLVSKDCLAKEILMTKGVNNVVVSYEIDDLLRADKEALAKSPRVQVYQIINNLEIDGISSTVPSLEITKVKDYDTFKSSGVGVLKRDKLIGYLNQDETKMLAFIRNEIKSGVLTMKIPDEENSFIGFEVIDNKTNIDTKFKGNKLSVDIVSHTSVNIPEIGTQVDYVADERRERVKQQLEKKMEGDITRLINKVQTEFGCDILGIGVEIHNEDPKLWEKYQDIWEETFKTLDINVSCNVVIKGTGINNKTIQFGE